MGFKSKAALKKAINNAVCGAAPGIFNDEYWHGHKLVMEALKEVEGIEANLDDAFYRHDFGSNPDGKQWNYEVTDGRFSVWMVVVAAGAGSVADPLSRYDIVAYAS